MTSQPIPVPAVGRIRGWLPAVVCGAGLIMMALAVLWLRQTSTHIATQGADALVIRAVLRMDTDPGATTRLTARLKERVPGLSVEVIDAAAGRSLLALQEPWIAEMPDFEVTPLPVLLEMRHPALLTNPPAVAQFVEQLKAEPEVDFVAYNETAHGRLARLSASTAAIQGHTVRWLLWSLALAGLAAHLAFALITPAKSLLGIFLRQTGIWAASWMAGVLAFRIWEKGAVAAGEWNRLGTTSYLAVGLAALFLMLLAEVINAIAAKLRRR